MNTDWKNFLIESGAEFSDPANELVTSFGNAEREDRLVLNGSAIYDLSDNALIIATGEDVVSFLQGQLSNDFATVSESQSQLSAYCSPKGRVLALFRISKLGDRYLLRLSSRLLENTLKRLKMFVMMAKVELEADDNLILFGASGPDSVAQLAQIFPTVPADVNAAVRFEDAILIRTHGIHPRFEILAPLEQAKTLWNKLNVHAAPVGHNASQLMQIQSGIPQFSEASVETQVPQMVNLKQLGAINFDKGCYPGQEIVARTHYLGKQKKRMYLASWHGSKKVNVGTRLYQGEDKNGEPVGTILYDAIHPDGRIVALAVLRIAAAEGDQRIFIEHDVDKEVEISAPPYGFEPATEQ